MSGNKPEPQPLDREALYNINDGLFGRQGGPYGDEVDVRTAEYQSAVREGREPDFNNLQPAPAVQLVNGGQLLASYNPTLIAGDEKRLVESQVTNVQAPVYGKTELPNTPTENASEGS